MSSNNRNLDSASQKSLVVFINHGFDKAVLIFPVKGIELTVDSRLADIEGGIEELVHLFLCLP